MAEPSGAERLRGLLRGELAARLSPDGWRELGGNTSSFRLTVLGRPLNADFMVTVEIHRASSGGPTASSGDGSDGRISYEPLRRLYLFLRDVQYGVLSGGFEPAFRDDDDDDEDDAGVTGCGSPSIKRPSRASSSRRLRSASSTSARSPS